MKKIFAAILLVIGMTFALAMPADGQGTIQTSFEYQGLRKNVDENHSFSIDKSHDLHGAAASVTGFFSDTVGVTGEAGFNFGTDSRYDNSLLTAMGGVTIKARNNKQWQPFARGLVGVARERETVSQLSFDTRDVGLAFAAGGGLDIKVDDNLSIRAFRADYMQTRLFGTVSHNLRLGVGIVF
jgi:hypothetical protein